MPDCPMTLDALRLYMFGCIAAVMFTDAARDIQTSAQQSDPPAPVFSRRPSDILLHGIDTRYMSQPTPVNANVRPTTRLPCRNSRHPLLLIFPTNPLAWAHTQAISVDVLVEVQEHAQNGNELLLVLFVALLKELQQYVLQVHVVDVSWRPAGFGRRRCDA